MSILYWQLVQLVAYAFIAIICWTLVVSGAIVWRDDTRGRDGWEFFVWLFMVAAGIASTAGALNMMVVIG